MQIYLQWRKIGKELAGTIVLIAGSRLINLIAQLELAGKDSQLVVYHTILRFKLNLVPISLEEFSLLGRHLGIDASQAINGNRISTIIGIIYAQVSLHHIGGIGSNVVLAHIVNHLIEFLLTIFRSYTLLPLLGSFVILLLLPIRHSAVYHIESEIAERLHYPAQILTGKRTGVIWELRILLGHAQDVLHGIVRTGCRRIASHIGQGWALDAQTVVIRQVLIDIGRRLHSFWLLVGQGEALQLVAVKETAYTQLLQTVRECQFLQLLAVVECTRANGLHAHREFHLLQAARLESQVSNLGYRSRHLQLLQCITSTEGSHRNQGERRRQGNLLQFLAVLKGTSTQALHRVRHQNRGNIRTLEGLLANLYQIFRKHNVGDGTLFVLGKSTGSDGNHLAYLALYLQRRRN